MKNKIKKNIKTLISFIKIPFDIFYKRYSKNNVIMIHYGRSGSTVLANLLHQHSQICWKGEIYPEKFSRDPDNFQIIIQQESSGMVYKYLKRSMRGTSKKYFGFEIKPFHISFLGEDIKNYLLKIKEYGVDKFILLERQNYLRIIVSSLVAGETNLWHTRDREKVKLTQIYIDLNNTCQDGTSKPLIEYLNEYQSNFLKIKNLLKDENLLELTYEDNINESPIIAYKMVCEFLNLRQEKSKVHFHKTTAFSLKDIISNFHEVEEYLSNTPYLWMLHQ
ncbi:hypothetical protein OAT18_02245 [Tenacibaculum sp.]|nr:hypothetical protein [Tenacibaculum sp.]